MDLRGRAFVGESMRRFSLLTLLALAMCRAPLVIIVALAVYARGDRGHPTNCPPPEVSRLASTHGASGAPAPEIVGDLLRRVGFQTRERLEARQRELFDGAGFTPRSDVPRG